MVLRFNPRAHAGRDPLFINRPFILNGFNPRAHAGRDWTLNAIRVGLLSFQSTRPRGARRKLMRHYQSFAWVSIHAPTRGATCKKSHAFTDPKFQSTRPRGARH